MKKIIVIGSGGAGKSTFSRRLGEKLGLPVVHLDRLYWRPNWTKTPREEWIPIVQREIDKAEWVIDGNFGNTREMRMRACDTVIFLDIPRWRCMYRILKRTALYRKNTRPDMAEGCRERLDLEFILWVWNYPKTGRKHLTAELASFPEKNVIVLRSTREIESFLQDL